MRPLITDLEQHLEADDGVVEVDRVAPHLTFPWASLKAGPRRWAPTDLSVEVDDGVLTVVRMTYRTVGDRIVVVAGAASGVDIDWLAERLATPLLFAHTRKVDQSASPAAIMASIDPRASWDPDGERPSSDGGRAPWRLGRCGSGSRPVRVAHREDPTGHLLVAAHGVAAEEAETLLASLEPIEPGSAGVEDLHVRHRRALAQRWWDAPRAPWTPKD